MSAPITIRMTLTSALEGKTKELNGHVFIKGVCEVTDQAEAIAGVTKYFTRSYQVTVEELGVDKEPESEPESEPDKEAVREDDEILGLEDKEDEKDQIVEPNARQRDIIAAVNDIDKEEWVDKQATLRPKVKDVATLMEDPTVSKVEIVEVIEKWLS